MKTIQLLKTLTDKERKELLSIRKIQRSKELTSLIKYLFKLIDKDLEYDKAVLFEAVYKQTYQEDMVQKLRRDQHAINQSVTELLVHHQLQKHLERDEVLRDYLLTECLFERGQTDLSKLEIEKLADLSEDKLILSRTLINPIFRINNLRMYHKYAEPITPKRYEEQLEILDRWKYLSELTAMRTQSFLNNITASTVSFHQRSSQQITEYDKIDLEEQKWGIEIEPYRNDPFIKSQLLGYKADMGNIYDKIEAFTERIALATGPDKRYHVSPNNLTSDYNRLAGSLVAIGKIEEAAACLLKAIHVREQEEAKLNEIPLEWDVMYENYIKLMLYKGDYESGIAMYENNLHRFRENKGTIDMRTSAASCYVMVGNADQARQLIFENSKYTDFKKLTDKQLTAICFFLEGNMELMERELENILQMLKTREHKQQDMFQHTTRRLLRFARYIQEPEGERKSQLTKLYQELPDLSPESPDLLSNHNIVDAWLEERITSWENPKRKRS